jgi:hypothetical protein
MAQVKRFEDRIAELSYWKQSATERLRHSERENDMLRRKIEGLVKLNDKLSSGDAHAQLFCQLFCLRAKKKCSVNLLLVFIS